MSDDFLDNLDEIHDRIKDKVLELEAYIEKLETALEFYADPYTYFAILLVPDRPCGDFITDFSEVYWEPAAGMVPKPGMRARVALGRETDEPGTEDEDRTADNPDREAGSGVADDHGRD